MDRRLAICAIGLSIGCGAGKDSSPLLRLAQLPGKHLVVISDGIRMQVQVAYQVSGDFCGTLRSPTATIGGRMMTLVTAGLRSYPAYYDGGMECDFPTFSWDGRPPSGMLVVSDGETSITAEFSTVDPGEATLLTDVDGGIHRGETIQWRMALPADGFQSYDVRSNDYFTGHEEAWDAGYSDASSLMTASVPSDASGTQTVSLEWVVPARVIDFDGGSAPEIFVGRITGFNASILQP